VLQLVGVHLTPSAKFCETLFTGWGVQHGEGHQVLPLDAVFKYIKLLGVQLWELPVVEHVKVMSEHSWWLAV
jgi:hypothetical protein